MNAKLNNLITLALSAARTHRALHGAMHSDLRSLSASEREEFLVAVATGVAKLYDVVWRIGQRGITFGVAGEPRTNDVLAAQQWFSTNITAYFKNGKVKAEAEPSKVWGEIVADLTEAKKIAKKLSSREQREFERRLAALIAEFSEE